MNVQVEQLKRWLDSESIVQENIRQEIGRACSYVTNF